MTASYTAFNNEIISLRKYAFNTWDLVKILIFINFYLYAVLKSSTNRQLFLF